MGNMTQSTVQHTRKVMSDIAYLVFKIIKMYLLTEKVPTQFQHLLWHKLFFFFCKVPRANLHFNRYYMNKSEFKFTCDFKDVWTS